MSFENPLTQNQPNPHNTNPQPSPGGPLESLASSSTEDPFALQGKTSTVEKPIRSSATAMAGKKVEIPPSKPLPEWEDKNQQDINDALNNDGMGDFSYSDLEAVNKELLTSRIRMNRIRRDMRDAGRAAVEAKMRYLRAYRRALIQQSGGTVETRKASAELLCEDLEAEMVMRQQVAEEYSSLFRATRDDVDNLKTVAFNLRALYQNI